MTSLIQRHDSVMNSMRQFVDDFYANLPPKDEMEAMVKEMHARKASKK